MANAPRSTRSCKSSVVSIDVAGLRGAELHRRQRDFPERHDIAEHDEDAIAAADSLAGEGNLRRGSSAHASPRM